MNRKRIFHDLQKAGATPFRELSFIDTQTILEEVLPLKRVRAQEIVGAHNVQQYFDFALLSEVNAPTTLRVLQSVGKDITTLFQKECDITFNEFILQQYSKCKNGVGITPHKDSPKYKYLNCIIVIQDRGQFVICEDRSLEKTHTIKAGVGGIILMRAPGLFGGDLGPYHAVINAENRITISMRCLI